jgi:hypothetical protein
MKEELPISGTFSKFAAKEEGDTLDESKSLLEYYYLHSMAIMKTSAK